MKESILVVDDDHLMRTRLVRALADRDFDAVGAENATEALAIACLLYTSPSPRDQRGSRMPSSA